jgi:hypothetical protein
MAYYRLYKRDGSPSGRFIGVEVINARDDSAAMEIAARHQDDFLELWQLDRRVASFEPVGAKSLG